MFPTPLILHGILKEEVYMLQPSGFHDTEHPHHICRLHKSLYGLKQSPRSWFHRLRDFLLTIGFNERISDTSLFIYDRDGVKMFLLVHVNDIVITSLSVSKINSTIAQLDDELCIKDRGNLNYFLGIHVCKYEHGLYLSRQ